MENDTLCGRDGVSLEGTGIMQKWIALLTVLSLSAPAIAVNPEAELDNNVASRAIAVADSYAVDHFGAPSCRDPHLNWQYRVHQSGSTLIADMGPRGRMPPLIIIVMRKSDLGIINASKRS